MRLFTHGASRRMLAKAARAQVCLDGAEVTSYCFYADTRRGVVRCYARNETGGYVIDHERRGLATIERRGKVVVKMRPKPKTKQGLG